MIWGQLAQVAGQYLHKGDQVYLEGKIDTRSYEKDGVTRYVTEILVSNMTMLGGKSQQSSAPLKGESAWDPEGPSAAPLSSVPSGGPSDDLPF